ncbi:MAG: alpha/beta hydrolase [Candidatus Omnitrophica bacterium]|nr:alpha/beta hydrolase [Candidatus Omnitrophota bacterium]MDE2009441.1 alpha/beta hydrolase [Candidatus Omnitrophota bacterium]MDE2214652.1 alpha/beta hydrolase [Candidatus Omnitrophota bacterium]MDE2231805.1 alpha/beta hydrolase [Candidatus Omnitrophota bacterium]
MAFFKTQRGLDWHYEISGSGEPVVMVHGLGASGRIWQAQRDFLHTDFQVLTVDLPGHGRSGWMPVSLTEMAGDIRQILQSLDVTQFSLAASSMGGLVALELYRMAPQDVMRMSLVGSVPKFAKGPGYPAGLDLEKIRTLGRQFDGDYALMLDVFFRSLFTMKERRCERFKWVKALRGKEPLPRREALKYFLDILEQADLRDRLASVICPLQFITGTEDYICPRAIMDWMSGHTHNARFDFIEAGGHLPFLVEAAEYNRLLEDFLLH